jgi:hypothetical protein
MEVSAVTDLVGRLRAHYAKRDLPPWSTVYEAADEIERLREEVVSLEGSECDCPAIQQADEIERLRSALGAVLTEPALPAALDLLRRGAGDLENDARIRWKQEVKDFLNASARSGG